MMVIQAQFSDWARTPILWLGATVNRMIRGRRCEPLGGITNPVSVMKRFDSPVLMILKLTLTGLALALSKILGILPRSLVQGSPKSTERKTNPKPESSRGWAKPASEGKNPAKARTVPNKRRVNLGVDFVYYCLLPLASCPVRSTIAEIHPEIQIVNNRARVI